MAWVSPTGHSDPDSKWSNETNAYDDDDATYASHASIPAGDVGSWLYLTISSQQFNRVQFKIYGEEDPYAFEVQVYVDAAWKIVYVGLKTKANQDGWHVASFTEGAVTQARVRFGAAYPGNPLDLARLYEFYFGAAPIVTTNVATNIGQDNAMLNGYLDSDGGETCDCCFQWGLTTGYGNTTPDQEKNTAEYFDEDITSLSPGTTYHFRAKASNTVDTGYGDDRTFITISGGYAFWM